MIRRLRERNEPIRLFGESDYDAYQRLKKLEILEPEVKVVSVICHTATHSLPIVIVCVLLFYIHLNHHTHGMKVCGCS